jgi:hypothetical protein
MNKLVRNLLVALWVVAMAMGGTLLLINTRLSAPPPGIPVGKAAPDLEFTAHFEQRQEVGHQSRQVGDVLQDVVGVHTVQTACLEAYLAAAATGQRGGQRQRRCEVQHEVRLTAEHGVGQGRGVFGLQWRELDFDAEGEEAFLPPSTTRNTGFFAFQEHRLGGVTLEAGARYENQHIRTADPDTLPSYEGSTLSGSVISSPRELRIAVCVASSRAICSPRPAWLEINDTTPQSF